MAQVNRPYGKDDPERFISGALTGGSGKSDEIETKSIGRGQTINTAFAMDNVKLAMPIESSIKDDYSGFGGGPDNLSHSLTGTSAVQED
jgi:hypothetical protein